MVGSGFSRNAEPTRSDVGFFPLWKDIAQEIAIALYPRTAQPLSPDNALKFAQEYKTAFGRSELHRLLGGLVQDDAFNPGDMHSGLLELPWRDVFTTNWDTLLERASLGIDERAYSVVQDMDQIPLMSQPRIFKLHGSLPAQFPLIVTEEDYRTYPQEYAPFVNTVQQAMMETVFLLIGFSGDDPNFLEWSGWVRDNLREGAPKIYLAGWLDLSPPRRRMLEERGVLPIDLSSHPQAQDWPDELCHQYATRWLLLSLLLGKPYDVTSWPSVPKHKEIDVPEYLEPVAHAMTDVPQDHPAVELDTSSPLYDNETTDRIREVLKAWAYNRKLYPGWLVYPSGQEQTQFSWATREWEPHIIESLPELSPVERLNAIRELVWRREIILEPITPDLEQAAEEILGVIDCEARIIKEGDETPDNWSEVREAWRVVALSLVTDARLECDGKLFERRLDYLMPFANDDPDVGHRLHQERCLWAVYSLDFEGLNVLLDDWPVESSDPIWMLRKAALLTEAHRYEESRPLVQSALNLTRKALLRTGDIASASREGWALWSTMTYDNIEAIVMRWAELASKKADAWTEKRRIADDIIGNEDRRTAPSFDIGVRRAGEIRLSNDQFRRAIAAYKAVRLPEVAGLPPTSNPKTDFQLPVVSASDILVPAADELVSINPELAARLTLRACSSDTDRTLERVLSRTRVATLSDESVKVLAHACISAANYTLPVLLAPTRTLGSMSWWTRTGVILEALSRLVMRLPVDMVESALDVGLKCYRTPGVTRNPSLTNSASNLLRRSWQALPEDHRAGRILELLALPTTEPASGSELDSLTDPGQFIGSSDLPLMRTPENETQFEEVVTQLVRSLQAGNSERWRAIRRLLPLVMANSLTTTENSEIAAALWRESDPVHINSSRAGAPLDWVYLLLPELKEGEAEKSFREKWLTKDADIEDGGSFHSSEVIAQVGAAVAGMSSRDRSFHLSPEEEELVAGHIACIVDSFFLPKISIHTGFMSNLAQLGRLALEITWPGDIAEAMIQKVEYLLSPQSDVRGFVIGSINQVRIAVGFELIPGLAKAMPQHADAITMMLRMGLTSDDDRRVEHSISALRTWVSASENEGMRLAPDDLVREVGFIIASRRSVALVDALWCATTVFDKGTAKHQEVIRDSVLRGLEYLIGELRYGRGEDDERNVPLLRLLCVQLSRCLAERGYGDEQTVSQWLEIGENDPFPEVRAVVNFHPS